jgi:hypothetical protein
VTSEVDAANSSTQVPTFSLSRTSVTAVRGEAQRRWTVRATVLLPGERDRKELMTSVAVRDAALIASNPSHTSVKPTAQSMNHAT